MNDRTTIVFNENEIGYEKLTKQTINSNSIFLILLITFVIFLISVIFSLARGFEWEPFMVLEKFKRIKKNMNSWSSIISEKTGLEINKGRLLYLTKPSVNNFQCMDYGSFYVPGHLSSASFLPEFIRRGNSGPWIINKANNDSDPSALQFCKFLLDKYVTKSNNLDNLITCGTDMFKKIGYGGYFIANSPCERAIEVLTNT